MNDISENIVDVILQASSEKNDHFNHIYDIENQLISEINNKIFLGDSKVKVCRFCGRDSSNTTFKKKAHVMSEFMGNKRFFSNFECDICNEHFSLYETSLSNYGGILNTFARIKGKKGYYKHKGLNERTETFVEGDFVKMFINEPTTNEIENFKSIRIDNINKKIRFNTNKYSFTPIHAYKTLIKIGLCLVNEDHLSDYISTIKWLLEESELELSANNPLFTVYQKIGPKIPKHPWALLMRKKHTFTKYPCPTNALIVTFGLYSFLVFIPGNNEDKWIWKKNKINLPIEQHFINSRELEEGNVEIWVDNVDLSSQELQKNPTDEFIVGFK